MAAFPGDWRGKVGLGPPSFFFAVLELNSGSRLLGKRWPLNHTTAPRSSFLPYLGSVLVLPQHLLSPPRTTQPWPVPHSVLALVSVQFTYRPLLQLVPEHPEFTELQLPVAAGLAMCVKVVFVASSTQAPCRTPALPSGGGWWLAWWHG